MMLRIIALLAAFTLHASACALCSFYTPTANVDIRFETANDTLKRVHFRWVFGKRFAEEITKQYDANENKRIDEGEFPAVNQALANYLPEGHFLTTITSGANNETLVPITIESWEFRMSQEEPTLEYTVALGIPIVHPTFLSITLFDPGRYFDFMMRSVDLPLGDRWHLSQKTDARSVRLAIHDKSLYAVSSISGAEEIFIEENAPEEANASSNPLVALLSTVLKQLSDTLSGYINDINTTGSFLAYLWLLLFSLIYGIVHAAGPGHGKSLVASYFLSSNRSYGKALHISAMIAVVHTFSAFASTLAIYFILDMFFAAFFDDLTLFTTRISAVLIMAIALYLLYRKLPKRKKVKGKMQWSAHPPACSCKACQTTETTDLGVIIAAGIIPCPGTVTIFMLTLSLGEYFVGFLSAVFMSIGMSLIIFLAATLSIKAKGQIEGRFGFLTRYVDYASLLFIFFLGLALWFVQPAL